MGTLSKDYHWVLVEILLHTLAELVETEAERAD